MFVIRNICKYSALHTKYNVISQIYSNNLKNSHVYTRLCTQNKLYCTNIIKISEAFSNLDNSYKQQQRIYKKDIEQLISSIENEDINEDNYLLLLQSCGHLIPNELPASRISLAQKAWDKLLNKNINLTTENYNALLQCYVENRMPISHSEFLQNMKSEPNVQTYDLLLECVCECGDLNQAVDIVNLMKKSGISATEPVFSNLILCHLRNGDIKSAHNILSTMRIAQISLSSKTYTALLRGYAELNELKLFENILNTAQNREFNMKQLISILHSVCVSEKIDLLPKIKKIWANKIDTRIFESKLKNLCIHLIYLGKPIIGYELYKTLIEPEVGFLTESDTYGSFFIYEMIKNNTMSVSSAIDSVCAIILLEIQNPFLYGICTKYIELAEGNVHTTGNIESFERNFPPGICTKYIELTEGNVLATSDFLLMTSAKKFLPPEIIINIADDLIKSNKNIYALFKATEIALRIPNIQLSLILLKALYDRKYPVKNHYFWPILIHEAKLYGEKGIFNIFDQMQQYNLQIETETLEVYSLQYIKNLDPDVIINKLKQFNLSVTDTLTPISVVLLREGKMKEVADITTKYKVKLDGIRLIKQLSTTYNKTKDVQNTIKILKNIHSKNISEDWAGQLISFNFTRSGTNIDYNLIYYLLKAYKNNNIKISAPFIDKIDYLCKKIDDKETKLKIQKVLHSLDVVNGLDRNNHIPHPRNMNLEELECHLIELKDKNMDTRGVLRKLIQMNCKYGNIDRATELYSEFLKMGYTVSPGMKSSLLDLYLKAEKFDKAWNEFKDLKQNYPNFVIDEFKIVDLARLLSINGKIKEADMLLQNESVLRKINGGNSMEHNCWKLLDTVAKMKKVKETKTLFKTLFDNNYCTDSNVMLGPLVRVHICNNDKKSAAEEYINCCTKYNKTPLLHELLCYLVKNESSSELIQAVVEATVLIHGAAQTQTSLAAALAETGLTKTLRKLFLDTNLFLSQKLLEQYCERWVKENKIHALKNIINSAKGINSVELTVVYFHLMRFYSSNNDCDSVLSLWHEMQDRNISSNDKIKSLVDTLISQTKTAQINKNLEC